MSSTTLLFFSLISLLFAVVALGRISVVRESLKSTKKKRSVAQDAAECRKQSFLRRHSSPEDYGYAMSQAGHIDTWRPKELPQLIPPIGFCANNNENHERTQDSSEEEKEVYVDYAAAALPLRSQLQQQYLQQQTALLANPHSTVGPASARTNHLVEQVKRQILQFLDAEPGQYAALQSSSSSSSKGSGTMKENLFDVHPGYEIVFTSGATEALRIVAEHFPWSRGSILAYPHAAHTSVVGMRELALARGAQFVCRPNVVDYCVRSITKKSSRSNSIDGLSKKTRPKHLLVQPLECNFGGDRCSFTSSGGLTIATDDDSQWSVMLDIAKAAATGPVSLKQLNPDFACLSFYKLFGAPTGLGALLIKRSALPLLTRANKQQQQQQHRSYFGGGSVQSVLASSDFVVRQSVAALSSGTCHFRGIVALQHGFDTLKRVGGMPAVRRHSVTLARELVRRLRQLRHETTSQPVICLYGAWAKYNDPTSTNLDTAKWEDLPGPTVAFNVFQPNGTGMVGYHEVAKLAALQKPPIQLRTGCVCNPGACQQALGWTEEELRHNFKNKGQECGGPVDTIDGRPTGVIRVSLGKDSLWEDVDTLVTFLERIYVAKKKDASSDRGSAGGQEGTHQQAVLSELYLFPIKSCAAQRVSEWEMDASTGKLWMDREFALVDASGSALRLQAYPKMAFLQPSINRETRTLTVTAPGQTPLTLRLDEEVGDNSCSVIKVCGGNRCSGRLWGGHGAAEWFSNYLGIQCWLARHRRAAFSSSTQPNRPSGVAFANEQPLLLISEHAVGCINEILSSQGHRLVTSKHFRPNLVVRLQGIAKDAHHHHHRHNQHTEDGWKCVSSKDMTWQVVGQCARCSMVDVDPSSGMKGKTLRALAEYRRNNGQITFGIFLRGHTPAASLAGKSIFSLREGDIFDCQ